MFNISLKQQKMKQKIASLEWELVLVKAARDRYEGYWHNLKADIESDRKKAEKEARNASIYIDFDKIDVFCIERAMRGEYAATEVSYWKEEIEEGQIVKKYKSLVFHCCDEIHEALVVDYENWKATQ